MHKINIKIGSNRSFGLVFFTFFLIIAMYPLLSGGQIRIWSMVIALIFFILGLINSQFLRPLNRLWFKFGLLLAKFVSPIIMGLVFFVVVTPTGIIMRLLKKDILKLKKNSSATYWIERPEQKSTMKDQF